MDSCAVCFMEFVLFLYQYYCFIEYNLFSARHLLKWSHVMSIWFTVTARTRSRQLKRQWGQWITWLTKVGHFTGGLANGQHSRSLRLGALQRGWIWWGQLLSSQSTICSQGTRWGISPCIQMWKVWFLFLKWKMNISFTWFPRVNMISSWM